MITVTPKATQLLTNYFKKNKTEPVRIFVKMGGCGMRSLGVALEGAEKSDDVFHIDGFTYIVDHQLLQKIQPITVDSDGTCFRLSGKGLHPPNGCGSCPYLCGSKGGKRCSGVCATCEDPCATGKRRAARRKRARDE
jgi:Fe-S cluster assembly iron-binding protein IscA